METTFTIPEIEEIIAKAEIEVLEDSVSIIIDDNDHYLNANLDTATDGFNLEFWDKNQQVELGDDVFNYIYRMFVKKYNDSIYMTTKYIKHYRN